MVRPARKITRKDLRRPDQFVTVTRQLLAFFQRYRQIVYGCVFGLGLMLVAIWVWDLYRERQNQQAGAEFSRAVALYSGRHYKEALESLRRIDGYRWSRYRRLALIYRANIHLAMNEPDQAVAALQELLRARNEPYLQQIALLSLGYSYEQAGKCDEAARQFADAEKIAGALKPDATLAKARCYVQSGKLKEALSSYRQYISDNPGSERAAEISLRVQELQAKTAAAPAK